jgi:hypothetical protein
MSALGTEPRSRFRITTALPLTVTLGPALALVDHCARRELQDHPRSTLAPWHYWLKARLESLFDLAAGWTLELIDWHWVSSPCQPSRACLLGALRCGGSMSTRHRSVRLALGHACIGCSTGRESRRGACQAHGCRQACTGARSLSLPPLCAVEGDWLLSRYA